MSEGAESILFREKFADWPEPGRIIKMKGHPSSSGEAKVTPMISAVLQPADVEKMLKPMAPFEGLRLDGENVHRGQGNFKVSRLVCLLVVASKNLNNVVMCCTACAYTCKPL